LLKRHGSAFAAMDALIPVSRSIPADSRRRADIENCASVTAWTVPFFHAVLSGNKSRSGGYDESSRAEFCDSPRRVCAGCDGSAWLRRPQLFGVFGCGNRLPRPVLRGLLTACRLRIPDGEECAVQWCAPVYRRTSGFRRDCRPRDRGFRAQLCSLRRPAAQHPATGVNQVCFRGLPAPLARSGGYDPVDVTGHGAGHDRAHAASRLKWLGHRRLGGADGRSHPGRIDSGAFV